MTQARDSARRTADRMVAAQNVGGGINHRPSSGKTDSAQWDPGGPYYKGSDRQARHATQALQEGTPAAVVGRSVAQGKDPRRST